MITLLLTLALLSAAPRSETYTIHPALGVGDFLSPAEALASPLVVDGDVLRVLPGTYVGTLLVDKAVTLASVHGPALTVLDGGGSGPVLEVSDGATIRGFTITGAAGFVSFGGVRITSASTVHLLDNVIAENHPTGDVGIPCGGVAVAAGASAVIAGNDIRANTSLSTGGVVAMGTSTVDLIGNHIRGNGGSGTITGGILWGASGRMVNNQITGNLGSGLGALFLAGAMGPPPHGAPTELVNNTIYGNFASAPTGSVGGIFFDDGGYVTIRNCLIHSNVGAAGMDMLLSSDFTSPPVLGVIDLDYSHVKVPPPGILPGPSMLPFFVDAKLTAPAFAGPFGPTAFGNFRPLRSSLDVDAGASVAFPADLPLEDLDGLARITATIDIGAFEASRFRSRGL